MKNLKYSFLSLSLLPILGAQIVYADTKEFNPKIDKFVIHQIKSKKMFSNNQILVVLKEQADLTVADNISSQKERARYVYDTLRNKAIVTQTSLVKFLKSEKFKFRQFYIENMILIENPTSELIQTLAKRSDVARIMGNPHVKLRLPEMNQTAKHISNVAVSGAEKNLMRIGAEKVWEKYGIKGQGIVVAGQDTGVQWTHPALKNHYRGLMSDGSINHNYNWHDAIHAPINLTGQSNSCGYDTTAPCDDQGHGTHTMGTIVGDDGKGNQIGVAPKAQWMACKNMDNGWGSPASYIECFEFFLAPYPVNGNPLTDGSPEKAPHVINNSWGCTAEEGCKGDEILPSLKALNKAGIFVVSSAGNEGPSCSSISSPPAWHSGLTLTVGAFDHRTDKIANFSSRGPSSFDGGTGPNIAAPGVNIRSSVPGNQYESWWSGTSMAGPHAVGAVALLWSYNNNLIGNQAKTIDILEATAIPATSNESCGGIPGSHIPNNTFGYGLLDIANAICSQDVNCNQS